MAHDREILRMIWEGQLPICFQADANEIVGMQPEPFFLMVSRLSYLPLVTDKVRKYFSRFIANEQQEDNTWFDFNGTALRLHYPIGVLYDLLHQDDDGSPWCLTIHFSKFPEETLVKLTTKELLESHYMSCLKEADVLKHRGQVISTMQKKDHNQLWLGLINDKFDQFWAVNRRLMEPNNEQETFKHIPVRFYEDDFTFTQKLISPLTEAGQKKSVSDLTAELSTPIRKAVRQTELMPTHAADINFTNSCPSRTLTSQEDAADNCLLDRVHIGFRTHGIELHEATQIQWMSEHLSYPDNFLHLFVIYENL